MANIKEYIKKVMDGTVSLEEQQAALAQVEKTIVEAKQRRDESVGQKADMVVQALKTIEAKLEAKLVELNNTPAMQGVQGPTGKAGKDGVDGKDGLNGVSGKDGKDGVNGVDGKDGVSVVDAKIDFDGSLVVYLSNGNEIDCGQILSPDVAQNIIISSGGSGTSQVVTDTLASLQAAITTLTTQIAPTTGIAGWNYSGLSKSISAEETAPSGLFFSPDGLNMYVCGSTGDDVNQYTLSTAFDVSTATFVRLFSVAAQDSAPADIFFKPDGLTMFILGDTNNGVFQYTLSSAFNISTASYASKAFSVTSQETTPTGLWFKPDGTVMYVIGTANDTVFQYTLGTAWDVSTASYASISFSVQTQETTPNQVNLSADGLTMWILGASGDDITQYALGTAWNVSTAVFENSFYIGFEDNNSQGLFIDSTANNRVYVLGTGTDVVYQYNTATNSISAVTDVFNTTSNARVQGNLAVQGNANIDGALTAQGSFTTASNITASGTISVAASATFSTTTGNIAIGTSLTSGTWTAGGTSGTGTITLGRSTLGQTTDIQAGATASGSTKAINIGTAGLSGSTTAINIGSAVSGATSTTTLNGLVIDSISAAVSAAGTTQGTATALVSNINNVTVVTAAAAGVRLPTAVAGMRILIRNSDSLDMLSIYPATGGTINALSANAAFTIIAGATIELVATTTTQWYTF
jgi:sugar lactone lactonase YvrE